MAKWTCLYSFVLVKIYDVGTLGNMGRTLSKYTWKLGQESMKETKLNFDLAV